MLICSLILGDSSKISFPVVVSPRRRSTDSCLEHSFLKSGALVIIVTLRFLASLFPLIASALGALPSSPWCWCAQALAAVLTAKSSQLPPSPENCPWPNRTGRLPYSTLETVSGQWLTDLGDQKTWMAFLCHVENNSVIRDLSKGFLVEPGGS